MAIIKNIERMEGDIWHMIITGVEKGDPGQFFMLRTLPLDCDPLLSRPMSIMDATDEETHFCYRVAGRGTSCFSRLRPGESISAMGPFGHGFPFVDVKSVLVGGGIGIAPLYYLAKVLKSCGANVSAFLSYAEEDDNFLLSQMKEVCDVVFVRKGAPVTDIVFCEKDSVYYACGPSAMLETISEKTRSVDAQCFVSLEKHMACGVGACQGCTIPTRSGNKRVCKDGPVFDAREIYYYD